MKRALLLNSTYEPLHFVSDIDAIILLYKGLVEVVSGEDGNPSVWDETFRSPSVEWHVPATIRLLHHVKRRWKPPRFRRKVLFNRDNWRCQYCSSKLNNDTVTIEHVFPSSRGGTTSWKNCVAACKQCNKKKANKTPEEANMKLLKQPAEPSTLHFWDAQKSNVWHPDWELFLPKA